ncbi:conjugal transfer protein TraN, partial [Pseudoalteromonas sp. SK20]
MEDKYCAKESLGVCYMKRQDYCCYGSILSRIVMEQAHVLLDK